MNQYGKIHPFKFTDRDVTILQLLAEGHSYKQISGLIYLSHRTVEAIGTRIKGKLNAKSMGHAVALGIRHQLIN